MTTATKHTFKLKYGDPSSWSYITLLRSDYVPATPTEDEIQAGEMSESGRWVVRGTSKSDLVANIRAIQDVFRKAKAFDDEPTGAYQVYLTYQEDGSAEIWESQVFEGRLELGSNALGAAWSNLAEYVTIIWRRAPWWEYYKDIPISNSNGASELDGLPVYNLGDGTGSAPTKQENWADIAAGVVLGDLPAPAVIELLNAPGGYFIDHVIICQNAKTTPLFVGLVEGETGTGDTDDANRSGGKYHTYAIPAGTSGINIAANSTALMAIKSGAWVRFLFSARFTGSIKVRPYIAINSAKYYGPASILTGNIYQFRLFDLGDVWKPAGSWNTLMEDGFLDFHVGINMISAAGESVDVDYFQYCPIDSFARAVFDTAILRMIIDCHDRQIFGNIGSDNLIWSVGTLYGSVLLEPGIAQRLVFKFNNVGEEILSASVNVILHCWCRKKTL